MFRCIATFVIFTIALTGVWAKADDHECDTPGAEFRFVAFDIIIDAGDAELGAYQLDIKDTTGIARIVGVEAGEHAAFAETPPYYDPEALNNEGRIVLAAYSTADDLPTGKTRVARLHMQLCGEQNADFDVQVIVAADADGKELDAIASIIEGK